MRRFQPLDSSTLTEAPRDEISKQRESKVKLMTPIFLQSDRYFLWRVERIDRNCFDQLGGHLMSLLPISSGE